VKLKSKHKRWIAIAAIVGGVVGVVIGLYLEETLPVEPPMEDPGWFETAKARSSREFFGYGLMAGGAFAVIVAVQELLRQARKLKR
jgi:hypothetical protein